MCITIVLSDVDQWSESRALTQPDNIQTHHFPCNVVALAWPPLNELKQLNEMSVIHDRRKMQFGFATPGLA